MLEGCGPASADPLPVALAQPVAQQSSHLVPADPWVVQGTPTMQTGASLCV